MKKIRILDISDMQNGFTQEDGNLYVKGARDIIAPVNNFLRQVQNGFFDYTLIILDTHFEEEYHQTEEGKKFPIHCEYGTRDWELAIDLPDMSKTLYLTKNQFNMWGEKKEQEIIFKDPVKKLAYDNLFYFMDNPHKPMVKSTRDDFITSLVPGSNGTSIDVTIIGVASDYCNRYAMEGWLGRGASVTIIHDLTKGIEKETLQILDEYAYRHYGKKRLQSIDSAEFLKEQKIS